MLFAKLVFLGLMMQAVGLLPNWVFEQIPFGELVGSCQDLILPAPRAGLDLLTQDRLTWCLCSRAAPLGPSMGQVFQHGAVSS